MQITYEQLNNHLQKNLAPVYLLSGEVPLLLQEGRDAICRAATAQGFTERELLQVETGFNWQNLITVANSRSLFSSKQLIELRITGNSINEAGNQALQTYTNKIPKDKILLIVMGKLDSKLQRAAWLQTINKTGIHVPLWPLDNTQLPRWITQRLAQRGLSADASGIQLLAERAEGNLLAAAQEIDKLQLLYGSGKLPVEAIADAVNDSARFDIFGLSDAALQGDAKRVLRILTGLHGENIEPVLILWALTRELRVLATLAGMLKNSSLENALQQQRIWEKRKPLFRYALKQHSLSSVQHLLQQAGRIDKIVKGMAAGNPWNELEQLGLAIAGTKLYDFNK